MSCNEPDAGAAVPAFESQNLTVRYGAFTALKNVTAKFEAGKIHAIVGQNGAGKTTYARAAAGLVEPAEGTLNVFGSALVGGGVGAARAAGVELVHQSFALPPSFTVAEVLQFVSPRRALFTKHGLERHWQAWLDNLGLGLVASTHIRDLPIEMQQSAEIARAMVSDAKLLILDEPTAVLSPQGIERLFGRIRELKAQGVTIMLVLHKIREVLDIADTISVLRGGELVTAAAPVNRYTAQELSSLIIGEAAAKLSAADSAALTGTGEQRGHVSKAATAMPALTMKAAVVTRTSSGPGLRNFDLNIAAGEIVGIAGVEGNGQRDMIATIAGLQKLKSGSVAISGIDVSAMPLATRRAAGLRIIPFERNVEGLSLSSPLWENWCASTLAGKAMLTPIKPRKLRADAAASFKDWDVRFSNADQPAGSLSGGNAQKVILAREIDGAAKLILAAQPTRGLDIGATASVWKALRRARERGAGVLLVSSDLDELFDICDRIIVIVSGQVAGEFAPPYQLVAVGHAITAARSTREVLA